MTRAILAPVVQVSAALLWIAALCLLCVGQAALWVADDLGQWASSDEEDLP